MNIGIDIDDTISETYATLLEYAQKYTIEELKRSPIIKSFNTEDHLYIENMHNWNENETARFWKKYYEEIIKKVNIKTFAANIIKELKESGDKIFLITARWNLKDNNKSYTSCQDTETYLKIKEKQSDPSGFFLLNFGRNSKIFLLRKKFSTDFWAQLSQKGSEILGFSTLFTGFSTGICVI